MAALIYGQPGTGKTTLACSAPGAVLFDCDRGINRINGAHRIPTLEVTSWEQILDALTEVEKTPDIRTIVIDTVGKMLVYIEDYIKRTEPKKCKADGTLNLQGFGRRKTIFVDFIKRTSIMGRNLIFVAHELERREDEHTEKRPEVAGSSVNDLIKELDLVGYVFMASNKRMITFDPTDKYYAKNTCNMYGLIEIPQTVDNNGNAVGNNNFFAQVIESFKAQQERNIEETKRYEALCAEIKEHADNITDADTANEYCKYVKELEHIQNSKAQALTYLQDKVKELELTFDSKTKKYV